MDQSFGARVRQHRERRGVTVAEIAEQTKIKASLLAGLERDDISQWPAGIFRRAYVRAYATAIGFDPDEAVREFLAVYPEPVEAPAPAPPPRAGLRALFESLRRRPVAPAAPNAPALENVTATLGTSTVAPPPPASPAGPIASVDKRTSDDLLTAARICTELGRVEETNQVLPLLREAAKVLDARGLIVWVWDAVAEQLRPVFVHGYSSKVRSRLRGVRADADNVTAAAFRAAAPLAKDGLEGASAALAVPMLTPAGCGGVLAIEVAAGREQDPVTRALATFVAAMLAQIVGAGAADAHTDTASGLSLEGQPG
jgi:transcriptional regulator with XRE-family HTH domain